MHSIEFIQDLAVIMLVSGLVTVVFHHFKQPVVLGYIVAGVIIGPHTPPFPLITNQETIATLAELGVVFLMFSLGLEFSLRKLREVGVTALVAALAEIVLMVWIGYEIGRFFNWKTMDSLFLGAMLAISSTTIIVKALDELGMKQERFAQLIFGILIVEDILAIGMIALLSGIATSGSLDAVQVVGTFTRLVIFMVAALVLGILIVPRLLAYVARFKSNEMLLITVLGLCFGFCLLVVKLDYSIALGAFVIGAIMAESRELKAIEQIIEPVRDMFSAIFFVAIGLLLDPKVLIEYALPVAVITLAVLLGKIVTCSMGTFIAGNDGRTSMRVGMGLAQIGEFSFIIAVLGTNLKVTSDFLYPIAVAVSAITTLLTPYLIRAADPFSRQLAKALPGKVAHVLRLYTQWLQDLQPAGDQAALAKIVRRILLQILVNFCLVAAIFLGGAFIANRGDSSFLTWLGDGNRRNTIIWGGALLLSLPFLVATYRKLKALGTLLAELSVDQGLTGRHTEKVRRVIAEVIPAVSMLGMLLLLSALSASILPPTEMLVFVGIGAALIVALLWQSFVKLHAKLQIALMETLQEGDRDH